MKKIQIDFSKRFEKQLRKSPKHIRQAFRDKFEIFLSNKYALSLRNHLLHGKYAGSRSIDITGNWRVIYTEQNDGSIKFHVIGMHSQLYK
jgi:addiction module RelE/StbE family toxin